MKKINKVYNSTVAIDLGGATRMGVALFDNIKGELIEYITIRRRDVKTNLEHRMKLIEVLHNLYDKYNFDIILFESIRLFSYGRIQLPTILSLNKVQTTIINEFSSICDIYQVDVRSWKSKVLGSAKADKNASLEFVKRKYPQVDLFDEINHPLKKEVEFQLNHDLADAIAISHLLKFDKSCLQDKNKMNYK